MKAEIRKLKLDDRVSLPGAVDKSKVPGVLSNGDIFLNTTNVDNTPVSVIEAMACGLPVVSTNVGGIPYLIENEVTGLLVEPGNAGQMANAVLRLFTDQELAQRISKNGRRLAESFDWGIVLPQWERLFSQVAAGEQVALA